MTRREYNSCVDLHANGVYRFVLKNLGNEEESKDIVQDVFAKLWVKAETVNFEKAKSYIFSAAYRTMLDHIKKHKTLSTEVVNYFEPKHESQYSDVQEILSDLLKLLPEKQRTAITLRDYEGYSYAEIAEITASNEAQVKINIFRARKFLKNKIKSIDALI
ncbi:MAG: RNA polymerase sigma factor [Flavobacteriales bacterium]|nr:RNA polymerase sigma factor [Flavobacteriales bacterium]MCB9198017.1 RNA polymerase sigma factor [Flavobacteriales bacterium]